MAKDEQHIFYGSKLKAKALARSDTVGAILARRDHADKTGGAGRLSLREHVFLFLVDPTSSRMATAFGNVMWIVLLASSISSVYETMRWATDLTGAEPWLYIRVITQIFYTAEAILRVMTFMPFRETYKDSLVVLDVLTAFPFWLRVALYPDSLKSSSCMLTGGRTRCLGKAAPCANVLSSIPGSSRPEQHNQIHDDPRPREHIYGASPQADAILRGVATDCNCRLQEHSAAPCAAIHALRHGLFLQHDHI